MEESQGSTCGFLLACLAAGLASSYYYAPTHFEAHEYVAALRTLCCMRQINTGAITTDYVPR